MCVLQVNVKAVRESLPKGDFSIMTEMLKKFLNFMNLTVSCTENINDKQKHVYKFFFFFVIRNNN